MLNLRPHKVDSAGIAASRITQPDTMESYLLPAFEELFEDDGLLVMGRGLGILQLYSKFIRYYSSKTVGRKLVLCLNANGFEDTIKSVLVSECVSPVDLPQVRVCRYWKLIDDKGSSIFFLLPVTNSHADLSVVVSR